MAFRNSPLGTYMAPRCGALPVRHPSGTLVGAYELRLNGRYYRYDGLDLTSGRLAEGRTAVSGSKKTAPFVYRSVLHTNPYCGGDKLGGVPV